MRKCSSVRILHVIHKLTGTGYRYLGDRQDEAVLARENAQNFPSGLDYGQKTLQVIICNKSLERFQKIRRVNLFLVTGS